MDEVAKVLPSLFRKQIRRPEPHLVDILLPLWPRITGKNMAQHSRPAFFVSGVLTLNTDCATWAKQLRYMAEEIRAGVNGFLGQPVVKKLRIQTVPQPVFAASFQPARGPRPGAPPALESVNTDTIADPEVAAALASSFAKYFNRARK